MNALTQKQFEIFNEWKRLEFKVRHISAAFQNDFELMESRDNNIRTAIVYNESFKEVKEQMGELHDISTNLFMELLKGSV
jgi:hypothetical protein